MSTEQAQGSLALPNRQEIASDAPETESHRSELIIAIISGLSLAVSFGLSYTGVQMPEAAGWPLDPAWVAVFLCGVPIIKEAAEAMIESFDVKAGLLISLALIAAVCVKEIFAAGEVAFLMMLGELLEERTVRRSKAGLKRLLNLSPQMAHLVENGVEKMIPASEVRAGQTLRVRPGETIAVDGVVTSGETAVDLSAITGESLPVDRLPGDKVLSGGLNRYGAIEMKAERVGSDSSLARLIRLVEEADSKKAKLARTADRWATVIVPAAIVLAIVVGLTTGDIIRAVSILIVFCPCGLVLATPTAIVAAIGAATKQGVLVRSGEALERLGKVNYMVFDKTGTLTTGELKLDAVRGFGLDEDEILALAASVESQSEHPLGQAIVQSAREKGLAFEPAGGFSMEPGLGVTAVIDGHEILAGRRAFMERGGLELPAETLAAENELSEAGDTVVWLARGGKIAGLLGLSDTIRPESRALMADLKAAGLKTALLTGDHEKAAGRVAGQLGFDDVRAGLLPEDKVRAIKELEAAGNIVAMTGDGLNDAPALKSASVGLAMGDVGSDVTIEAADVALLSGNLRPLPYLMNLSRRTLSTIKVNISLAMGINIVAVILAATGVMGPVMSALVHNLGAIVVVLNATRLYNFKLR
ncbi:copper-translocating P-type ATPase [Deltaproteobacteria bacterium Smac51]|nr:copper-translocating P-type ATPase [Deltaproteobacteria bacterium Smac51]